MAYWLSWLERRPVTAEVEGSSPFWVVLWDLSSAGRASALQAEGHRFEPCRSHLFYHRVFHFIDFKVFAAKAYDIASGVVNIIITPTWLNWQSS